MKAWRCFGRRSRSGSLPHDAVRTSFNLETMTSAWSGASAIPRFAEIARRHRRQRRRRDALDRIAAGRACAPSGAL